MLFVQNETATFSPKHLFCGWSFRRSMAALERNTVRIRELLPKPAAKAQTLCSTASQHTMLFWTAAFIRLQVILSVRGSYSEKEKEKVYLQRCRTGGFGCSSEGYVMVANRTHSQGQSAALRTCKTCKTFRSEAGAKEKKKGSRPIVHFAVFPEGVSRSCAVGA